MDFETMMGPVMYQDIPSSFGLNPMPSVMPNGIYPGMGQIRLQPELKDDKFEQVDKKGKKEKKAEGKHTFRNIMIGLGSVALAVLAVKFGPKAYKALFPNGFKAGMQSLWTKIKTGCTKAWDAVKNLFNKQQAAPTNPPAPPAP